MGRTACTESQCLYKGALYLYLILELYLYYPYGPYGLYRASMPVQGCTLPLPNIRAIPVLPLWAVRPVQCLSACTRVHFTSTFLHYVIFSYRLFRTLLEDVESEYSEGLTRQEFRWLRENIVDVVDIVDIIMSELINRI